MKYIIQNVAEVQHGVVAHGVNCRGVMGSGVAGALRKKYQNIFPPYKKLCDQYSNNPSHLLGKVNFVSISDNWQSAEPPQLIVANCFTQLNFGSDGLVYADIDAITHALDRVFHMASMYSLPVYMPKIGCGLGGLSWENDVLPVTKSAWKRYNEHTKGLELLICDL